MVAKVENYCAQHTRMKSISISGDTKACINCIWYEQYHRPNRGNVRTWVPTDIGNCILNDCLHRALDKPCKKFETE